MVEAEFVDTRAKQTVFHFRGKRALDIQVSVYGLMNNYKFS